MLLMCDISVSQLSKELKIILISLKREWSWKTWVSKAPLTPRAIVRISTLCSLWLFEFGRQRRYNLWNLSCMGRTWSWFFRNHKAIGSSPRSWSLAQALRKPPGEYPWLLGPSWLSRSMSECLEHPRGMEVWRLASRNRYCGPEGLIRRRWPNFVPVKGILSDPCLPPMLERAGKQVAYG